MHGCLLLTVVLVSVVGIAHCAPPNILSQIFADLKQGYQGKLSDLQADFNRRDIQTGKQKQNVAFYAELSTDSTNIETSQTIVYDTVPINTGNGYSRSSGTFTAPTSGSYVFTWTNGVTDTNMQTTLVSTTVELGEVVHGVGDSHYEEATGLNTSVLHLEEGDVVWTRATTVHSGPIAGKRLLTFAGWLVR